ncbi:Aminoglycoside phosphotransferase [Gracilaria domingensis]|nr:Aminoglycoside phosphotransferase [Gracilaria domingensis]
MTIHVEPYCEPVLQYLAKYVTDGLDVNGNQLYPHSKAGWFCEASKWLTGKIREYSNDDVDEIVKVSTGSTGCVLRAKTVRGTNFYMKAVNADSVYDQIGVACALSEVMPEYFNKLVAVDRERRWMLMNDYGTAIDNDECKMNKNPKLVKAVLEEWGRAQEASIDVVIQLKEEGIPVVGAAKIKEMLERVVSDPNWYEAQLAQMKREKVKLYDRQEYIQRFVSYADDVLKRVSEFNVPKTLVHGDLSPVNVMSSSKAGFTFFDFEATSISFPLLDVLKFMSVCNGYRKVTYDEISFYAKRWSKYESKERLKDMIGVVSEVRNLIDAWMGYELWNNAEESDRKAMFSEMGTLVSEDFEAWEKSSKV